jgi:hypothetical protein
MILIENTEQYRLDSEEEVTEFIEKAKAIAAEKGYTIKSYSSTKKQRKRKGEVIAEGYLVKITKSYESFWDEVVEC